MRRNFAFAFVAAVLGVPAWAGVATVADYPMQAREVAPGVYAVVTPARDFPNPENKGWNSNSTFVVTGKGVLVVDTGSSETIGKALAATIARTTKEPVRWVINTHGHGDHWLGNAAVAGADTEIISSTAVRDRIRTELDYWTELFDRMTGGAVGKSTLRAPTRTLDARTTIELGGMKVELIPSGNSHSTGDLLVWLPEKRVLMGGDVLYSDRAPSTYEADVKQWIAFLGELEKLGAVAVVPGHGSAGDARIITDLRRYFETIWAIVKRGYDAGKTDFEILPVVKTEMAPMAKHFEGFEDKVGASVSRFYLAIEQSAF